MHFYGLKNFFSDAKKVPYTHSIETSQKYIYKKCWIILAKILLLKILIKLKINPFPAIAMIKDLLGFYQKTLAKIKK